MPHFNDPKPKRPVLHALWTLAPYILMLFAGGGAGYLAGSPTVVHVQEVIPAVAENAVPVAIDGPTDDPPFVVDSGWVPNPDAVDEVISQMAVPYFADTAAGKVVQGEPQSMYLWQVHEKATGSPPKVHNQNPVGSCVSFGTSRPCRAVAGQPDHRGRPVRIRVPVRRSGVRRPPVSRSAAGGFAGTGASARGGQVRQRVGGLPRGTYEADGKTYDLTTYDPGRCRDWGRAGVPDQLEPETRKFPAGDAAMVTTWDEAKKALAQGYGIAIVL